LSHNSKKDSDSYCFIFENLTFKRELKFILLDESKNIVFMIKNTEVSSKTNDSNYFSFDDYSNQILKRPSDWTQRKGTDQENIDLYFERYFEKIKPILSNELMPILTGKFWPVVRFDPERYIG
jgi:hypothetical protein